MKKNPTVLDYVYLIHQIKFTRYEYYGFYFIDRRRREGPPPGGRRRRDITPPGVKDSNSIDLER